MVDGVEGRRQASVRAENLARHRRGQRQVVEDSYELEPHAGRAVLVKGEVTQWHTKRKTDRERKTERRETHTRTQMERGTWGKVRAMTRTRVVLYENKQKQKKRGEGNKGASKEEECRNEAFVTSHRLHVRAPCGGTRRRTRKPG